MKIKTSELTGPALDWAVAKCEGYDESWLTRQASNHNPDTRCIPGYSTDWAQGGPIIERELVALSPYLYSDDAWQATIASPNKHYCAYGLTPLIAAMRCFVASKLGDEVDVPDELT